MKKFAIAINSEKDYSKVKEYAQKWGFERRDGFIFNLRHPLVHFQGLKFNSCDSTPAPIIMDWKWTIRKNSPLTLHNTCVRIDTEERVKEVWDIIKDCGININIITSNAMIRSCVDKKHIFLNFNDYEFIRTSLIHEGETEISPKQLAHLIRVEQSKKESPEKPQEIISTKDKKVSEIVFDAIFGPKEEEAIKEIDAVLFKEIDAVLFSNNRDLKTKTVERSLRKNGQLIDGILVENIKQLLDVLVTYDTIGWHLNGRPIQATVLGNESQSFVIEFNEDFSILNKTENQVTISYKQFKYLNIN